MTAIIDSIDITEIANELGAATTTTDGTKDSAAHIAITATGSIVVREWVTS